MEFKFNLGDQVKDKLSGFVGVVQSRTEYFNGCIRYGVYKQVSAGKNEDPSEYFFDEAQLLLVKAGKVKPPKIEVRTGGGRPAPRRGL